MGGGCYCHAMPGLHQVLIFAGAALVLALLPGPGVFYVAARTLAGGRAEGVASSLGTGLGGMVHVLAGALGVSAIVLASAQLFAALKLAGAIYLLWLGVAAIRAAGRDAAAMTAMVDTAPAGTARAFRDGVLVEALNPKTAVFFLALLPQFVVPAQGQVALQFAVLGLVSIALNTAADLAVAFAAGSLRGRLTGNARLVQRLREASGAAMIALGAGLLLTRRPV